MNICVHAFVKTYVFNSFLDIIPRSRIVGSYDMSVFTFSGTAKVFSKDVGSILCYHLAMHEGFSCSLFLPAVDEVCLFYYHLLEYMTWYLVVTLIFVSPVTNDFEDLLACLLSHLYIFFRNICIQILSPFLFA
jgi:hypothetical protein